MQPDLTGQVKRFKDSSRRIEMEKTHKMVGVTPRSMPVVDSSRPSYKKRIPERGLVPVVNAHEAANIQMLREQCERLCLTLFASEHTAIKSVGFTSAIGGEGKSFLATVTAQMLARDSLEPVTLVECNWMHPTLHEKFGIPATPGLAEWLRGSCNDSEIRYETGANLTVIPAGDGAYDAVKLLKRVQQYGLQKIFKPDELLVFDLPPIIASSYGTLASSLVDTVVMVVQSGVTPSRMLFEACAQLRDVSVHGIILNQANSRIPRWIRQIL